MIPSPEQRCWLLSALAFWLACASPNLAHAQGIEAARNLYFEAEFEEAIEAFEAILQLEELSAVHAADAHRYLAALHLMTGDADAAGSHATAAVALNPDTEAPEGAPPDVAVLLTNAAEEIGNAPASLEIEVEGELAIGVETRVTATLSPPSRVLAPEIILFCESGDADIEVGSRPPSVTVVLRPGADTAECEASALSAGGATLLSSASTLVVGGGADGGGDDGVLWGVLGATGGLVVVGVIVLIVAVVAQPTGANIGEPVIQW